MQELQSTSSLGPAATRHYTCPDSVAGIFQWWLRGSPAQEAVLLWLWGGLCRKAGNKLLCHKKASCTNEITQTAVLWLCRH